MDKENGAPCSITTLSQELAGCRVTTSPFFPSVTLHRMIADVTDCRLVKESDKRQVYYLKTHDGSYFLKRSILIRTKDRLRHFLMPRRRWAEWRNLHRLRARQIAAAGPVLKGENIGSYPKFFFLLTERVYGTRLRCNSLTDVKNVGQYLALLHSRGVYHADLHPDNIIIGFDNKPCLIDVQEIYFLPWFPRWLRIYNLGKLLSHFVGQPDLESWSERFLAGYNHGRVSSVTLSELFRAAERHRQRHYRSRSKRNSKNSTEFEIIKSNLLRGYKRRDFKWGAQEIRQALDKGIMIKPGRILSFQGVCIKFHKKKLFHQDRCLASWKMSRALEVRGIPVPRSLGYFVMNGYSFFLSQFLADSMSLNHYISSITEEWQKREALRKLALWLTKIHEQNVWQRDFKSSNILCRNGDYFMIDLEGVRIRRLSNLNKIINLAQLNASIGNAVTLKDRLRFYYHYSSDEKLLWKQRRAVYRKVWEISKTKNTTAYNLDMNKLKPLGP